MISDSRRLAIESKSASEKTQSSVQDIYDPQRSVLLAIESLKILQTPEGMQSLQDAIMSLTNQAYAIDLDEENGDLSASPDGKFLGCFDRHRRRYGSRRTAKELKIGRFLVRRVRCEAGLQAIQPKSFVPRTTNSRHGGRIAPNLLKEIEVIDEAGQIIVGDITYLPLQNGKFCYLASFQDKLTRRIVGWAIASEMTAELVVRALQMALRRGLIAKQAIVHTDRGSQYVSNMYRELFERHNLRQSMSGRGSCYDNAQADAFFWPL